MTLQISNIVDYVGYPSFMFDERKLDEYYKDVRNIFQIILN